MEVVKVAISFRTACGDAQHNEGHNFVCETLNATGINPGPHCTSYQQKQDQKLSEDKQRKSTTKFKIRRRQLHLNRFQSTVRNENREGLSYEHNIGLTLSRRFVHKTTKTTKFCRKWTRTLVKLNYRNTNV